MVHIKEMVDAKVKRGPESWAFIYITLGFVLTIEGTLVPMFTPLTFPYNVATYIVLAALTIWLFLGSGWFQNKLIGWKRRYEEKARTPWLTGPGP